MGNGAAAGVMAADFLIVMNRVLFLKMPVNLSHQEHPACSAGNPNSLSVSVILLFPTFLPPLPRRRYLATRQLLMRAQIAAHPHRISRRSSVVGFLIPSLTFLL